MKPNKFDYLHPQTVNEALDCLAQHGENARMIAGGLSLGAMLNFRLVEPEVLIDISTLEELSYIKRDGDWVEVGAATTQAELLAWPELPQLLPLLAHAMPNIGHYQTRSRGTVCGSICHSEPSSELPLSFATLGGEAVLKSKKRGERRMPASEFQIGMLSNAREQDEMVVAVRFPVSTNGNGYAFQEFAQRRGDFAIVAVSAVSGKDHIRVGIGGVADRPSIRDIPVDADLDEALNRIAWELGGFTDIHATAQYRRRLVRKMGRQVIEEAKQNATA